MNHFKNARRLRAERIRWAFAAIALSSLAATAQAPGDIRIALVIGNSAYPGRAALVNPASDAAAMSATLSTLGFSVVEVRDGSLAQMSQAVSKVRERLKGQQGIGMLYYAGHGLQVEFRNYLVPIDARLAAASDVSRQTLDVGSVIEAFQAAGNRMNIVVLDACRDNPFPDTGTGKGLAPVDAPTGTFLAYATAPGNVAADGDAQAGNGLYTGYLVRELQKPAARIEDVFKRVRFQVRQHSKGQQIPWESTSLEEEFFFNDGVKHTFRPDDLKRIADQAQVRQEQLRLEAGQAREQERRNAASKALEQLRASEAERVRELEFASQQASDNERLKRLSAHEAREQSFRTEMADWERIKDSRKAEDFYAFLQKYPGGSIAELVQFRLDQLQKAQVSPAPGANGIKQLESGALRYSKGDKFTYDEIDGFTGKAQRFTHRVTATDGERVEINDGKTVLDQMGGVIKNRFGVKNPAAVVAPAELALGKRWRTAFTNTQPDGDIGTNFWESKVVAIEEVTVPAGKFVAFKVERRGEARFSNGKITFMTGTAWIDPQTMLVVRHDLLFRSGGKIGENSSTQLVGIQRAPRLAP
jgi:uncharacterized caspase-like protein